jgi:hypothetical protein
MFLNIFVNPKSKTIMKKVNLFAIMLVAGFFYFLGTTLYSQTTFVDNKCKCCDETCVMTDCCKNCGDGTSQGNAGTCCANCTSDKCKECCASTGGCMNKDASTGTTGSEHAHKCGDSMKNCSKGEGSSEHQQNCCSKK